MVGVHAPRLSINKVINLRYTLSIFTDRLFSFDFEQQDNLDQIILYSQIIYLSFLYYRINLCLCQKRYKMKIGFENATFRCKFGKFK